MSTKQALVTYFCQSAFTVALKKTLLIFSYRQTDLPQLPENLWLSEKDFHGFNNILVFVPNAAFKHHDPAIYSWKRSFPITYVLTRKAAKAAPEIANLRLCQEGDQFTVGMSRITVHGSTDKGVSFLVEAEGLCVFHAGDLNLWHWREENSLRDIARAEQQFYDVVAKIPKNKIDICFFPLDPNQGGLYDAGANHIIMALRPRVFFPMHFGARGEIAAEYARRGLSRHTAVFALTEPRESALVDLTGRYPLVRASTPSRLERRQGKGFVDLSAYAAEDPFAHTDLPVDLQEEGKRE